MYKKSSILHYRWMFYLSWNMKLYYSRMRRLFTSFSRRDPNPARPSLKSQFREDESHRDPEETRIRRICPLLRKRQGHPVFCCVKMYQRQSQLFTLHMITMFSAPYEPSQAKMNSLSFVPERVRCIHITDPDKYPVHEAIPQKDLRYEPI